MTDLGNFPFQEDDFQSSSEKLPLLMILNPATAKGGESGFWLKLEEAQDANFLQTEQGWKIPEWMEESSIYFKKSKEEEAGFLFKRFRGIILHESKRIIQRWEENRWVPVGNFEECPDEQEMLFQNVKTVRIRRYFLVLLVDNNNRPVHETPLLLSMGLGPGSAIGSFLNGRDSYFTDINNVMKKRGRGSLSGKGRSAIVVDFSLGETDTGQSEFMAPLEGVKPSSKQEGDDLKEIVEESYQGRKVVRREVPIERLLVDPQAYSHIAELWETYKDWFAQRYYKQKPAEAGNSTPPSSPDEDFVEDDDIAF